MGFLRVPRKSWGKRSYGFIAVEIIEGPDHRGPNVTLPSGVTVYNNGRAIYATAEEQSVNLKKGEHVEEPVAV
jgi:hypothetical protein